jgi:hypothetical protein
MKPKEYFIEGEIIPVLIKIEHLDKALVLTFNKEGVGEYISIIPDNIPQVNFDTTGV